MTEKTDKEFVNDIKKKNVKVIVHWDGKLLKNTTQNDGIDANIVDRLPIVVTGKNVSKTLHIAKMQSGSGQATAEVIFDVLSQWELLDQVIGFCYDTTKSNTGNISGAVVLLNSKFDSKKLNFECRHHVAELYMAAVFETLMGKSG